MKRIWLLALAIVILQPASYSQTTVAVRVVDAESLDRVEGAIVTLDEQKAASDPRGMVHFTDIHAGNHTLTVRKEGFIATTREITVTTTPTEIEVAMHRSEFQLAPIEVNALRASDRFSPVTFSELRSETLEEKYFVQDVPEMLSILPSTTFYSENGNGIGYNYLRIRGFEQRRLAVMINGVPQNDPEDHNVYWLDFADLLSTTENIQVQRGAGSAFYGPPAIGGSINIVTGDFLNRKGIVVATGVGSYNTNRYSLSYGSGMIDNAYSFYAKFSKTTSDGYREKSWTNFNSYYFTASRYDARTTTRINVYGGPISDGLAYYGLPKFAVKDKLLRRANYNYWESDGAAYTYTQPRRPREVEEFSQPHFELLHEWRPSNSVTINNTLFYVIGQGFFDYDGTGWTDTTYYRLTSEYGFPGAQNPGHPLIRAYVDNNQVGWLPRITWKQEDATITAGFELRRHRSVHWGRLEWADNLPVNLDVDRHYYDYRGGKDITSAYVQVMMQLTPQLNAMANVQYVFNRYRLFDEAFLGNDFTVDYHFLNPRLGVNYNIDEHFNTYANASYTSREPRLKNLYDAAESSGGATPQFERAADGSYDFSKPLVKPEELINFELGGGYQRDGFSLLANAYMMNFENEIVKSGQLDRFGQPVTGNAKRTVHTGVELSASYKLTDEFEFAANGAYSINRLKDHTIYRRTGSAVFPVTFDGNPIAGFPDYLANVSATYRWNGVTANATLKSVGPQYTDNEKNENNKVDAFMVVNASLAYRTPSFLGLRAAMVRVAVNNALDHLYAASGEGDQFFVAAERNFYFDISLEL